MCEPATALAIISTCAVISVGGFPPEYELYFLGDLGQQFTWGLELNDHGQIVGYGFNPSWEAHGFLWDNGRMLDLDEGFADPELILAIGAAIADDGTVAVYAWDGKSTLTARVAVWRDGVATVFPLPDECDYAGDINAIDTGGTMIVGECRETGANYQLFPVIWRVSDGTPTLIARPDDIPAEADGEVFDINRHGTAVLYYSLSGAPEQRSFYWRDGELEEIQNPFESGNRLNAYKVNDNEGYLAGADDELDSSRSIFVDGEEVSIINTMGPYDLNNAGVVVGKGVGPSPMVWFSGTSVNLVDYFGEIYEDIWPQAINSYGWITGYAEVAPVDVTDAWLLVPLYDKGDYDGDGDVDLQDSGHFQRCFAAEDYIDGTLHVGCSVFDFDDDVDLDLDDYAAFQSAFTGPTAPNLNPNGPG